MKINLTDHVLRLAKRAPSASERMATYSSVVREGRTSAGAAVDQASTGGIPVRKAHIVPPEADFQIRFISSQASRPKPIVGRPGYLTRNQPPGLLAGISRQDIEALKDLEPALLKWIAANNENAARFFANPVGSLDLAGLKLTRSLRLRILTSRKRIASARVKLPPVRIRSIKVRG